MNNEHRMEQTTDRENPSLTELLQSLQGLIGKLAADSAKSYHCWRTDDCGIPTDYTRELLANLNSVGILEALERIREGSHDSSLGAWTTYLVPFLDGAMRRYLETNMGTLTTDRDSMALVRKAQMLYDREGLSADQIAEALHITPVEAQRAIRYATHFFSTEDLAGGLEFLDSVTESTLFSTPEAALVKKLRQQKLHHAFSALCKRDQELLGGIYGVFGYQRISITELAIRNLLTESGVEKAKKAALRKLKKQLREDDLYDRVQLARLLLRKVREEFPLF